MSCDPCEMCDDCGYCVRSPVHANRCTDHTDNTAAEVNDLIRQASILLDRARAKMRVGFRT